MARYIDRDKLIKDINEVIRKDLEDGSYPCNFSAGVIVDIRERIVKEQPTADVVEVKHGKNVTQANYVDEFICSECGIVIQDLSRYDPDENYYFEYECKYCPNCGAKMDQQ